MHLEIRLWSVQLIVSFIPVIVSSDSVFVLSEFILVKNDYFIKVTQSDHFCQFRMLKFQK